MPIIRLTLGDLGDELRSLPKRDAAAIKRAIHQTASVDAHRWIQWSIHGGGWGGDEAAPASRHQATEDERRQAKKPRARKGSPQLAGRLAAKLRPKKGEKAKKAASPSVPEYRMPVDTGDYKNSFRTDFLENGDAVIYSAASPPIKAGVIEEGRRPKGIPIEPLVRWVERKLGLQGRDAQSVAFLISRKASKAARPGLHVLKRARPKIAEALRVNLKRELRR